MSKGAPDFPIDRVFPFLAVFAVANTALINMMMASRLLYGMAKQDVLPRSLAKVSPNTPRALDGHHLLDRAGAGTDLVRRPRTPRATSSSTSPAPRRCCSSASSRSSTSPAWSCGATGARACSARPGLTPALAAAACLFLIGPWVDRDTIVYQIAGGLLVIGVVLWALTWLTNRGIRAKKTGFRDIEHLEDSDTRDHK